MACINKSMPGYAEFIKKYGDSLGRSLIVNNGMAIPDDATAQKMVKGSLVAQYKKALQYLDTTVSSDVETLVDNMFRIIDRKGNVYIVNPGGTGTEAPALVAQPNIRFLQAVNQAVGPLFAIKAPEPGKSLFAAPNPETAVISESYKAANGIETSPGAPIYKLDAANSMRIADAYQAMAHNPSDPEVAASYAAMAAETIAQYDAIVAAGYVPEIYSGTGEPYKNSAEMIADVRDNKHQYVLSTAAYFGETAITPEQIAENPLLADSGKKDANGFPLLVNDVFRFVHDFFGHTERGNSFGAVGEENAWDVHARMYSPLARRAMTTETRGQNSWVNFGPQLRNEQGEIIKKGEPGYLSVTERPFAEQKIGLLPEEFSQIRGDFPSMASRSRTEVDAKDFPGKQELIAKIRDYQEKYKGIDRLNTVQFADMVLPAEVVEKYKPLYEISSKLQVNVMVQPEIDYGAFMQYGMNSVLMTAQNILEDADSMDYFVEGFNHEIIHGIVERTATYDNQKQKELHNKLEEVYLLATAHYEREGLNDKDIQHALGAIDDYAEQGAFRDYSGDEDMDYYDRPVIRNLEEMMTWGLTNKKFADYLDSIPYQNADGTPVTEKKSLFQFLKDLIRDIVRGFAGPSALDRVTEIMDEYLNISENVRRYEENRQEFLDPNNDRRWDARDTKEFGRPTTFSELRGGPATEVEINGSVLNDIVDANKAKPQPDTEIKLNEGQESQFQRETTEEIWTPEQKKRFSLNTMIRGLSKRFGIQFEIVNDPNSSWRGKFQNGKVFINEAKVNPDTAFHEVLHPYVMMLQNSNPELYASLLSELENSKLGTDILDMVQRNYPELTASEQQNEALVEMLGRMAYDSSINQSLLDRVMNWVKTILSELGLYSADVNAQTTMQELADLIANPSYSYDLSEARNMADMATYYQKASSPEARIQFDNMVNDTLRKLRADAAIPGQSDSERQRKSQSRNQAKNIAAAIAADKNDITALNSFINSSLFNMKDLNDKFDAYKTAYENKKNKTPKDIQTMSRLLNEIEDSIALYRNTADLVDSILEAFPAEKDNMTDFQVSLKREKRLLQGYKDWSGKVLADWLAPYAKKAVNKAKTSGDIFNVVSKDVYTRVKGRLAEAGITDSDAILNEAVREEIIESLKVARDDASWPTSLLGGVLNSRDIISNLVGLSIMDEITKALQKGRHAEKRFRQLLRQHRGISAFTTKAAEKEFYQKYTRKVKLWSYVGLDENAKEKYEYKEYDAFHEQYKWDEYYNAQREAFEKIGPAPTGPAAKTGYKVWLAQRQAWKNANTVVNAAGVRVPSAKYVNPEFAALYTDPLFKEMYDGYKVANEKFGTAALKYGIVPQNKDESFAQKAKRLSKPKNVVEAFRETIGDQEQVFFAQKINGGERMTIPTSFTRLLEPEELSWNLIDSVSKFTTGAEKYKAMSEIEPHVQILKNFIGSSSELGIPTRQTVKKSSSGLRALSKLENQLLTTDATKLNESLDSFLNDAVYGHSMQKSAFQMWDGKYEFWKTNDKSNNGGPAVTTVTGFENVRQELNLPNLDYDGFNFNQERKVGEYTIKMVKKDWNISVKKSSGFLAMGAAFTNMVINPTSAAINLIRAKIEQYVEATGGKHFSYKDIMFGDAQYVKNIGAFMQDINGGKPSFISSMLIDYDAIQGELQDTYGNTLQPGIANKLFRRNHLFFMQNLGEHQSQTALMIAMMNKQKITTKAGTPMSLYAAKKAVYEGTLTDADLNWTEEQQREFRENLNAVNKQLNGNYSKIDKANLQRKWWGSLILMFRKHIYNGFANRYRKGRVNYETGYFTEGYWRTFASGLMSEGKYALLNFKLNQASPNSAEWGYAARKFVGDLAVFGLLLALFMGADDDDEENDASDWFALVSRRLMSESMQYTPFVGSAELVGIVKNPSATIGVAEGWINVISQAITDPDAEYERSGPGYNAGDLKWKVKMGRVVPLYRQVVNTADPERMLEYYRLNSWFWAPSAGTPEEEEETN